MSNNDSGIFLSNASNFSKFPREFNRGLFGRFEKHFALILLVCAVVIFSFIGILSLRKPTAVVSEKEITKIQERYARLVLKQPEPEVKQSIQNKKRTSVTAEVQKKQQEKVQVDREKETFVEKQKRKKAGSQQRRQVRKQVEKQIQSTGIFAAITSSGSGTALATSASDLLGSTGGSISDLGELNIDKGTFATKNVNTAELTRKKTRRRTGVGIKKEQMRKAKVTQVAKAGSIKISSKAPKVTGESSSHSDRSQAVIQRIVNREKRRLKRVYEEWLKRDPALSGHLTVKFVILPSGSVSTVSVVKSTTNNSDFDETVLRYIRRWRFPAVTSGSPVEVVYPFVFEGLS